jgi:hypothetical protein
MIDKDCIEMQRGVNEMIDCGVNIIYTTISDFVDIG